MSEEQGTFVPVGETEERMFGPTAMLLCGLTADQQNLFSQTLGANGLGGIPLLCALRDDLGRTCMDLVTSGRPRGTTSDLPKAVVVSGLLEKELHAVMACYRKASLPRPLWAALTEHSQDWKLGALISELEAERQAVAKALQEESSKQK